MSLKDLIQELLKIRDEVLKADHEFYPAIHPNYEYSARNLLRYLRLRSFDLHKIQTSLASLGLSSLSHSERQVLANIENILYLLSNITQEQFRGSYPFGKHPVNFAESGKRLRENTQRLFGKHVERNATMVTLSPKAVSKAYMEELLTSGMTVARINTASDDQQIWKQYVENIRTCCSELNKECSIYFDLVGAKVRVLECSPATHGKKHPVVRIGDQVHLVEELGNYPEDYPKDHILFTCTEPGIITNLKVGDRISFDDGKIGGHVTSLGPGSTSIEITSASSKGGKLRIKKGMNLPDTAIDLPALNRVDLRNLDYIAEEADMVGFSFVRYPEDIAILQNELGKRGREDLGIILKIETQQAFENLPQLLLQAMTSPNIGVMTARGDLAVELGLERLAEVQEEIMWICESAMVPNIWATEVLQNQVKKGKASRAEITDAAMSVRTECVMLNKGPFQVQALRTLNDVLERMDDHIDKKLGTMRKLKLAEEFWKDNNKETEQLIPILEDRDQT